MLTPEFRSPRRFRLDLRSWRLSRGARRDDILTIVFHGQAAFGTGEPGVSRAVVLLLFQLFDFRRISLHVSRILIPLRLLCIRKLVEICWVLWCGRCGDASLVMRFQVVMGFAVVLARFLRLLCHNN